jgi:hypothetical protein
MGPQSGHLPGDADSLPRTNRRPVLLPDPAQPPNLRQLAHPDPVHPPIKHDLGMLAIADIAAEDPDATFPQDRHAGSPDGARLGGH